MTLLRTFFCGWFFTATLQTAAQPDSIKVINHPDSIVSRQHKFAVEAGAIMTSAQMPFLLKINQFGTLPERGAAAFTRLSASGQLNRRSTAAVHVGYSVEVVGNVGQSTRLLLPEAFLRVSSKRWELWAGRRKMVYGLGDTLLTSGFYLFSNNALPIPRVQLGTPGFVNVPFTKGWIAVNALISHGWFGRQDSTQNYYLHQKSLYIRVGHERDYLQLYIGGAHGAQWGGYSKYLANIPGFTKNGYFGSSLRDFGYIILANKPDDGANTPSINIANRAGNHLGTIDAAINGKNGTIDWMAYYQHPFEDKSGIAFQNMPDGIWGIRFINNKVSRKSFLRRFNIEYIHTKSQSGSFGDEDIPGARYTGVDDYFNHSQYRDGWTYNQNTIGTPFITPKNNLTNDLQKKPILKPSYTSDWSIRNNRVSAIYIATVMQLNTGQLIEIRFSHSKNFGLYRYPFMSSIEQMSYLAKVYWISKRKSNFQIITTIAGDTGGLVPRSLSGMMTFKLICM